MTTPELRVTSDITVEEVRWAGDDLLLWGAAKVIPKEELIALYGEEPPESLEGLLRYMMRHRHGSPFEHGYLCIRVHAPIKVFREWHRHRVGWSYNEESGRYKELEPVFYKPPKERPMIRPSGFKPANPTFELASKQQYEDIVSSLEKGYYDAYRRYRDMVETGVDLGLARDVLGVGIYSSCYCSANPRSIMHFLELRTEVDKAKRPSKPLYEIAVAAGKLEGIFASHWPVTYAAWNEYGRMAP